MPEIRTLITLPDGTVLRGYEVNFEVEKESWSVYTLDNNIRLRTKHTALKIFLLVDEKDELLVDELGEPQVFINGSVSAVVSTINKDSE